MRRAGGIRAGIEPEAVRVRLLGGFGVTVGSRTIEAGGWQLKKAASLVNLLALAIVVEVFVGLLQADPNSYLRQDPNWKPTLGQDQNFEVADLLRFAGVA